MMSLILIYGPLAMPGYLPFVFVDFVFSDIIDDVSRDELIFTSPLSHNLRSFYSVVGCNEKSADCEVKCSTPMLEIILLGPLLLLLRHVTATLHSHRHTDTKNNHL